MRKALHVIAISVLIYSGSYAQNENAFQRGTNLINLGVGLGDVYWGAGYGSSGLPFSLNAIYEHGITDKLGIGYIGVGAQLGYASQKYSYDGTEAWKSTGILIAVRGSFHFNISSAIGKKLDPYAGVLIGYVLTNYSYNYGYGSGYGPLGKAGGVVPGIYAGAHYLFGPHFGVYGELGYTGFSILSLGVCLKF
jgi:hypothetical protein